MVKVVPPLLILFLLGLSLSVRAQETRASPEVAPQKKGKRNLIDFHGYLLGIVSGRVTGERPPGDEGGDFVLGEERLRLEMKWTNRSGSVVVLGKGDVVHDALVNEVYGDLREAYAGYSRRHFDLRFGRQIATWGVGDLFYINDIFPKDWESFFSGRPIEYLKLGVDGSRAQVFSNILNVDFFVIPLFTPDNLPSAERFFFFNPFSGVTNVVETEPDVSLSNVQLALRLYRRVENFDLSFYAYRGFWLTPGIQVDDPAAPTVATEFFPRLNVYGASLQRPLLGGVMSFETGYYDSRQDNDGNDPSIPNSEWRFLIGYQHELRRDLTAGFQFYGELMDDYGAYRASLPTGFPARDHFRGVVSVRFTQWLRYQTLKLSLFAAFSPTDVDYFLQPEITYKVMDKLGITVGMNIFGGKDETTFFGQFEESDNAFLNIRYDF